MLTCSRIVRVVRNARFAAAGLLGVLLLLGAVAPAFAHPLGNFTINRYSRLEAGARQVRLIYIVDMAEIPAHAERAAMDDDGDGTLSADEIERYRQARSEEWRMGLALRAGRETLPLRTVESQLSFPEGQAGLPTLRMVTVYVADLELDNATAVTYRDGNFADRIGWQEIVVTASAGAQLLASTAPSQDVSQGLTVYPDDLLSNPPRVQEASFELAPAAGNTHVTRNTQHAIAPAPVTAAGRPSDPFAELVAIPDLGPWAVAMALLAALGWGAVHALSPGHGKSIVAAYLVGTRGTVKHALFLGLTTTVTHTLGVFALGGVTLLLANFILPEQLYPWLSTISGLLVVLIGLSLVRTRLQGQRHGHSHGHDHGHAHLHAHDEEGHSHHDHGHQHSHSHLPPGADGRPLTWRSLLALGVSGGLLPCPSALVLMLAAISLDRVGFGLLLIVAFSLGLAGVLTLFGIALLHAGRLFTLIPEGGRLLRLAPVGAALFITAAGVVITVQAVGQVMG